MLNFKTIETLKPNSAIIDITKSEFMEEIKFTI